MKSVMYYFQVIFNLCNQINQICIFNKILDRVWFWSPLQTLLGSSRNASRGEALRDDPSNGCIGD